MLSGKKLLLVFYFFAVGFSDSKIQYPDNMFKNTGLSQHGCISVMQEDICLCINVATR